MPRLNELVTMAGETRSSCQSTSNFQGKVFGSPQFTGALEFLVMTLLGGRAPRAADQDILMDTALANPIPNDQADEIAMPEWAKKIESDVALPSVVRAAGHPRYNCHGLVFGARRASIRGDAAVNQILREDGYKRIDEAEALPGDSVIYVNSQGAIEHSGLVASRPQPPLNSPYVCSKWGDAGPEVIHPVRSCPYSAAELQYYRVTYD